MVWECFGGDENVVIGIRIITIVCGGGSYKSEIWIFQVAWPKADSPVFLNTCMEVKGTKANQN